MVAAGRRLWDRQPGELGGHLNRDGLAERVPAFPLYRHPFGAL